MVDALTLELLYDKLRERYTPYEQRVVGIMFARYDLRNVQEIIDQNYLYWNLNSNKLFDIYWAGYGAYLSPCEENAYKKILRYAGNDENVYYDMNAFITIKKQFNDVFGVKYKDRIQLILVNYKNHKLRFNESIKIDLEQNIDDNYATIRDIIEFVTDACRATNDVKEIAKQMKLQKVHEWIQGITLSDVLNTAMTLVSI